MARAARLVIPDVPHHLTHRGSYGQPVFFSDTDRRLYLDLFAESAEMAQVRLWGWCLMSNHVHWIVVPQTEASLAKLVRRAHSGYARYRNLTQRNAGHLWHGRFYSSAMDEAHCWYALAYVERNPVRAGIVRAAEHYRWSSAALHVHTTTNPPPNWLDTNPWRQNYTPESWKVALATSIGRESDERRLREATRANLPWMTPATLAQWEQRTGLDLKVRPQGRPPGTSRKLITTETQPAGNG